MEFDFNEMLHNYCNHQQFGVHCNNPVLSNALRYRSISSALHNYYEDEMIDFYYMLIDSNLSFSKTVDDYADYYGEFEKYFTMDQGTDDEYTVYTVKFSNM